jgi:hypothetical protein
MGTRGRRKCLHCGELFTPDPRNRRHQRYCSKTPCRKASKAASQHRWLAKAENRDYFRGLAAVARVRAWRADHPGYWRGGSKSMDALKEDSQAQATEQTEKSANLAGFALQDLLCTQPAVLIGLIANLTGSALQEDIARAAWRFQQLGQDIVAGAERTDGGCDEKTPVGPGAGAPGPHAVQLGRSALGSVMAISATVRRMDWHCTCCWSRWPMPKG